MKRPDQPQEERSAQAINAWVPLIAAAMVIVTGCVSTFLVLLLDEFRPKLGDMVVYRPGSQDTDLWQMALPAYPSSAETAPVCVLDPNVMAAEGGSLVVEARLTDANRYMVHWAGRATSAGATDCGAAADVWISRQDLQRLANAAGGFGIRDKGIRDKSMRDKGFGSRAS
jgi:hypothetical protein